MVRVVIATSNPGKISEIQDLLGDAAETVSLRDLDIDGAEETGATFEENAVLKAVHAARQSGLIAVADDSGIEVDALGGAPGVWSARYAGTSATDSDNRMRLLRDLANQGDVDRSAGFTCVIAVAQPSGHTRTFRGEMRGRIASEPRGSGGFGYDSLMLLDDGRTVAELTADEKNRISHRGTALRNALPYLKNLLAEAEED